MTELEDVVIKPLIANSTIKFYTRFVDDTLLPSKHLLFSKTSSRRIEDAFSVTLFVFQDVFLKRLQDVFKACLQDVLQLCLQDVFKTSWKKKKCYTKDVFKTPSRRLQYVLTKANVFWVVIKPDNVKEVHNSLNKFDKI